MINPIDHEIDDPTLLTIDKWIEDQIPIRLRYFKGNKTKTAISLGMNRRTLYRKIKKFEYQARMKRLNPGGRNG